MPVTAARWMRGSGDDDDARGDSGVYFCRLEAGRIIESKKLVLVK